MNSRGNEIWLGGIVDQDLLLLSTKGICIWLGGNGDPLAFVFQQWSERENSRTENEWLTYLLKEEEGPFIARGRELAVWKDSCAPPVVSPVEPALQPAAPVVTSVGPARRPK